MKKWFKPHPLISLDQGPSMTLSPFLLKALNSLMTAAFVFSVVVQYNDPDPIRWMLIYGAAAAACILSLRGKLRWTVPAAIGLVALVWAGSIAPRVIGQVRFADMFQSFEMKDPMVEEAREMGGLLIVWAWMAVLVAVSRKAKPREG